MPHIVIKAIKGATEAQIQQAAHDIVQAASRALDKGVETFSVAVEQYERTEWKGVYNNEIQGKSNILIQPGYDIKLFD